MKVTDDTRLAEALVARLTGRAPDGTACLPEAGLEADGELALPGLVVEVTVRVRHAVTYDQRARYIALALARLEEHPRILLGSCGMDTRRRRFLQSGRCHKSRTHAIVREGRPSWPYSSEHRGPWPATVEYVCATHAQQYHHYWRPEWVLAVVALPKRALATLRTRAQSAEDRRQREARQIETLLVWGRWWCREARRPTDDLAQARARRDGRP